MVHCVKKQKNVLRMGNLNMYKFMTPNEVWEKIRSEAHDMMFREPMLGSYFLQCIINQKSLSGALSFQLANRLGGSVMPPVVLREIFTDAYDSDPDIISAAAADLEAVKERDPAVRSYAAPLLYLKGYQSIQAYRTAHWLWNDGRLDMAYFLQNLISTAFAVDIHPAARIGRGIMFDHATGIVIGETAVVGDNVSFLHNVTLGGTGHEQGDRHPKVGSGVMFGAGASILGNITIGDGAKIGAGSVVLHSVPAHTTVVGVPAHVTGRPESDMPACDMNQNI